MSVKVTESIYETEVVEVSELPKVKTVKDDSLFLIVQDGRSRQAEFKMIKAEAVKAAAEDTKERLVPIAESISSISNDVEDLKSMQQDDVGIVSAAIKQSADQLSSNLSYVISTTAASLSVSFDDKLQKEFYKIRELEKFVDDQELSSIRSQLIDINYNMNHVSADAAKTAKDLFSTTESLKAQIKTEVDASADKTLKAGTSYTDDEVEKTTRTLETKITNVNTTLTTRVESLFKNLNNSDLQLAADLDSKTNELSNSLDSLSDGITTDLSSLSSAISAYLVDNAALSTQLYGEDGDILHVSSDISSLDVKLYGIKIEEMNESNEILTTVISAGDIDILSAEVSSLSSDVSSLTVEVANLKTSFDTYKKTATVIEEVQAGNYTLEADSIKLCKMNINKAGYEPIAVTTVKIFDEHQVEQEKVLALNRYIVSDEGAAVELKNELNTDVNVNVNLKVIYVESK